MKAFTVSKAVTALMLAGLVLLPLYSQLSGKSVADVTYRPDDLPEADAKLLRDLATPSLPAS